MPNHPNSNQPSIAQRLKDWRAARQSQHQTDHHQLALDTRHLLDTLAKDRKSERRWQLARRLMTLIFLAVITYSCMSFQPDMTQLDMHRNLALFDTQITTEPHIAVVNLVGIIAEGELSANQFNNRLKDAFENDASEAVFIYANSPGGSPVQSALINDAISRLKAKHDKPVLAIVADVCASGCYYALANVDEIIVNPSSLLGSIGVRMESFDLRGLMQKIGVQQRLITAGENKAMLNPFGEFPQAERDYLQDLISKTHQEFIDVVENSRGNQLQGDRDDIYSGLIWTGRDSIELGLADKLGDLQTAAAEFDNLTLQVYNGQPNLLEEFLGAMWASLRQSADNLSHLQSRWSPQ